VKVFIFQKPLSGAVGSVC